MTPSSPQELQQSRDRLRDIEDDSRTVRNQVTLAKRQRPFNPHRLMALTFLVLIAIGGFLLNTPWAQAAGCWSWETGGTTFTWGTFWHALLNNYFMATSTSCVTGLTVVDVPTYYSTFGHVVLAACMQLGGLSLLTLGTVIVTLLLGRLSASGEAQISMNYGSHAGGAGKLLWKTIRYSFGFEALGALVLFADYHWRYGYESGKALWYATFHAISAFCNAGISLHSDNLQGFSGDLSYILTIALLVTIGGIGFLVIANLAQYRFWRRDLRKRGRITLHTRLVLWMTLILTIGGGIVFTALEWNHSLGANEGEALWRQVLNGDFAAGLATFHDYLGKIGDGIAQSSMFRTAGFNMVPMEAITPSSNLLSTLMMLIGGSPGSMAGGIKTTTLLVILLSIRAYIRGNPEVQIHGRTLSNAICREAMVIVFFYLCTVFLFYFVLLLSESALTAQRGDFALFYEVSSALGTVGVSLNATPLLTPIGKGIIMLAMFLGRIGPISIALMMASRGYARRVRLPEETITVG